MLAVIFNTCGIRTEHVNEYIEAISRVVAQDLDTKIVVSSCLNSDSCISTIKDRFQDKVVINRILDKLPVNVTFNHSCLLANKLYGDLDGYLYMDSGVMLKTRQDLSNLNKLFMSDDYGMVAAQVDTDGGYHQWFGLGKNDLDHSTNHLFFESGDFVIPIGKTINLHCQIFSKKLLDFYGYLFPDIYAGYCSESVFSFVCAAIKTKFVLSKDVIVSHIHGMDGGSSGFDPVAWKRSGKETYEHPFMVDSVVRIAKEGHQYGFGYEECQNIVNHDPDKFDGFMAKDDRLKDFIKSTQFIGNSVFDYSTIASEVI